MQHKQAGRIEEPASIAGIVTIGEKHYDNLCVVRTTFGSFEQFETVYSKELLK